MKKIDKYQKLEVSTLFQNVEKVNPFFSKVKIYVLYEGLNRNGSNISKEAIMRAIPSVYNIPIVGEYLEEVKNFGDHGVSLDINEEGEISFALSTRPYGTVPESAKIYWETVMEEDGSEREYLVVDGALLWSGRYSELNSITDEGYFGQSMEIEIVNGHFAIKDGREVLNIEDFIFSAFCLLGINKQSDPTGEVTPAFEQAKVVAYSLDKESFKLQFNQMLEELKFTTEGGNKQMEHNNDLFLKSELTSILPELTSVIPELNYNAEIEEELKKAIEGNPAASVVEVAPIVDPIKEEPELEDNPEIEPNSIPENNPEPLTEDGGEGEGETTFSISEDEYNALVANFEALKLELAELQTYKRNRELDDLKEKFSTQVTEQEFSSIIVEKKDATIEELEVEIFALIGRKNYSLTTKSKTNKVIVSPKESENDYNPYGDIFN